MKRKRVSQIKVTEQNFKKVKKQKQSVIICLATEDNLAIAADDTVVLSCGNKTIRKKVKRIHKYDTYSDLCDSINNKKLGYKKHEGHEITFAESDIKQHGILAIELKIKKHLLRKFILYFGAIIFAVVGIIYLKTVLRDMNDEKMGNKVQLLNMERTKFVFVNINPSLVLTIKDNVVTDVACLNDDCLNIYNQINIKGKNLEDSVDSLYNLSKSEGFDVSNGVTIMSNDNIETINKSYVSIEYISNDKQNKLLDQVKNNEDIKKINNDDYYDNLWNVLKQDDDYDKVYTCKKANDKLVCHFIMSAIDHEYNNDRDYNFENESQYEKFVAFFKSQSNLITRTFKKFGYEVSGNTVLIHGTKYSYIPLFTFQDVPYKNVLRGELIYNLPDDVCRQGFAPYQNGVYCQIRDGYYLLEISKINLVDSSSILDNVIVKYLGLKDNIMKKYELFQSLNSSNNNEIVDEETKKEEAEKEAQRQKQIDQIIKHRNELIKEGYGLNREETDKRCTGSEEFCEYLCLYPMTSAGYQDSEQPAINCELLKF